MTLPNDDDIKIEVFESIITKNRYTVRASFDPDQDPYVYKCSGEGYAQEGTFYKWLNFGDSLEASLKKATCVAIKELKRDWLQRESRRKINVGLTNICKEFVKECEK
jgi:hypothetical protein